MANIDYETDITTEMYETLVQASLDGEDAALALKKIVPKTWTVNDTKKAIRYMQSQKDKISEIKKSVIDLETASLIDHDKDTIMLMYQRLIEKANAEGKYEVVTRILREIRQMKAIENEQMKFEIVITVQEQPKEAEEGKNSNAD